MFKRYSFLIVLFLFCVVLPISSYSQDIGDEMFEDEGYVTHKEDMPVPAVENAGGGVLFNKDSNLSEDENNLINAVFARDNKTLSELLKKGVNPNIKYNSSTDNESKKLVTPIHIAIVNKDMDIIESLLKTENIDLNIPSYMTVTKNNEVYSSCITPLSFAVYNDSKKIAEMLIKKGAEVRKVADKCENPIFYASNKEMVNFLRDNKCNLNDMDSKGNRALFYAVESKNNMLISALIENGANVNEKNSRNETLLFKAIEKENYDIARYLIDAGAKINEPSGSKKITPVMQTLANKNHDAGFLRYLIFKGASVVKRDADGRYPVFYLVEFSNKDKIDDMKESLSILIENGADINSQDKDGNTVVHLHSGYYYQLYAQFKPDINIQNKYGNTPLHVAAKEGNVRSILTGMPKRDIKNKKGERAIDIAEKAGNKEAVTLLKMNPYEFLLMAGSEYGNVDMVNTAIKNKVNLNNKILGNLPLYYAAKGGNPEVFITLVAHGAVLGRSPNLIYDIIKSFNEEKDQMNRVKLVNIFIDKEASYNWKKYDDILSMLVYEQCHENRGQGFIRNVISYALEKGADPNYKDEQGRTPLHIASTGKYKCYDVVVELISHGVDVDLRDKDNKTALLNCAQNPNNKSSAFISMLNNTKTDINATYGEKGNTLLMEAAQNGNKLIVMMLIARGANENIKNKDNKTALELASDKLKTIDKGTADNVSEEYKNYNFIVNKFLADKNTIAECRSGINEECKKYYKPVEVINKTEKAK